MTAQDIITNALMEIGAYAPGESLSAADANFGLGKLNDILDEWAARKAFAYNVAFQQFTLTPGHAPHLIGPGLGAPDFAVVQRPVRIEGATIIINSGPAAVDVPINVSRDADWWNGQRVKSLQSSIPTDLYYSPDWPNGALNFWPVPNTNYGVRLEMWGLLSQFVNLTDTFSLPPAYRQALTLTLAEYLAAPFGTQASPLLLGRAMKAREALQKNNLKSPKTSSTDVGVPGQKRTGFNWTTGS